MEVFYYFDENRPEKDKKIVQSIYGNEVTYFSERPWLMADSFKEDDILICSSVEDLVSDESLSDNIDEIVKEYMNILNRGVELVFDKSTQCNSLFIKTLLTGTQEFEGILRKCVMNYTGQKDIAIKYSRKHVVTAAANGKKVGIKKGTRLVTKKSVAMKVQIKAHSKDYDGDMSDEELMAKLGIARNSYYKYKRELKEELTDGISESE